MFEREIFKDLKLWIPDIRLTMGSGSGSIEKADLYSDAFKIIIECKRYTLLKETMLMKFWDKLVKQAIEEEYIPYLIFKNNHEPIKVMYGYSKVITDSGVTRVPVVKDFLTWKMEVHANLTTKQKQGIIPPMDSDSAELARVKIPEDYEIDLRAVWERADRDENSFIELYSKIVAHETIHLEQFKAVFGGNDWVEYITAEMVG
jgi:hypothetical protein